METNLIDKLSHKSTLYKYFEYLLENRASKRLEIDYKGLMAKPFKLDLLDDCIIILESAFTPETDAPGAYKAEKGRLSNLFISSYTKVFYLHDIPIGMFCYNNGEIEYICVVKDYQSKGYGKIILSQLINLMIDEKIIALHLCTAVTNMK